METQTRCPTPARRASEQMLPAVVVKNSIAVAALSVTLLSESITASAPANASRRPVPV